MSEDSREKIMKTITFLVLLLVAGVMAYGIKTDCPDTAGIYVKCAP